MTGAAPAAQAEALHALVTLVQLEKRLRWAAPEEARFIAVNDTHRLVPYRQAVLLEWEQGLPQLMRATAASGIVEVDPDSDIVRGLLAVLRPLADTLSAQVQDIARAEDHLLIVPLQAPQSVRRAALCLLRAQPMTQAEDAILEKLADALSAALALGRPPGFVARQSKWLQGRRRWQLLAGVALLLMLPIRASVLAPAEVVADDPVIIRAPLQGVIAAVNVAPNQAVHKGDVLVTFDEEELRARAETTRQAVAAAATELRQAYVQAVSKPEARADIATIDGRLQQQKINLSYAESQLSRGAVTAPADGVAVFDNVYDWIGRNVSLGERIMLLADPTRTRLRIQLPVSDNIALDEGAKVLFFSDATPADPSAATLSYVAYRAAMDDHNVLSYRLDARWGDGEQDLPRLGAAGTAKVYGHWRPLAWHLLRKPLAALRRLTGW